MPYKPKINRPVHHSFENSDMNNNNNNIELSPEEIMQQDELIRQYEEQLEQHRLEKESHDKKSCIGKACMRLKRFFTGKSKSSKGGNRTRKSQRRRKH
jgi:hypothetical protein